MDLSTLTMAPGARKKRKRVGRGPGSGNGKTAGRGHKGQKSRSGYSRRAGFEGGQMPLNRRLPKRGFRHQKRHPFALVNLGLVEEAFEAGAEVTPASLAESGVVEPLKGGVKLLARGELTKALTVKVNAVSESARKKIEAAGGTIEIVPVPVSRAVRLRNSRKREER
jgi:large subunit ribosomal protein L15